MKEQIADAGNTDVPSYLVLKAKGYQITVIPIEGSHEETWIAETETVRLMANGPVTLLGLASMYENRGSDWKASDEAIEDFVKRFCS